MANPEHLKILKQGVKAWNKWREENPDIWPDLSEEDIGAVLREAASNAAGSQLRTMGDKLQLRDINLSYTNLRFSTLIKTNLSCANLDSALLDRADFTGSDFRAVNSQQCSTQSHFRGIQSATNANFSNCRFMGTVFSPEGTSFEEANFTNAEFNNCDLSGQNLRSADFKSSDFIYDFGPNHTNSVHRVDLSATHIYEAQFWRKGLHQSYSDTCEIQISSTSELLNELKNKKSQKFTYFRGQPNFEYSLIPSLLRANVSHDRQQAESKTLEHIAQMHPDDFPSGISAFDALMKAQHFGLKTRLLDVTRNPLVALYNACKQEGGADDSKDAGLFFLTVPFGLQKSATSDAVSIIANLCRLNWRQQQAVLTRDMGENYFESWKRLIHFIRQEKPYFEERVDIRDLFQVFVVEPRQSFERIKAQSGAFMISALHRDFLPEAQRKLVPNVPTFSCLKYCIPADAKKGILAELDLLNINERTLFPRLENTAKWIESQYS